MAIDDRTPPPSVLTRPRVLVVDDEPSIRMIARLILERAGYTVEEAGDAAAGRVALAERPFVLALLDISLPDRSGVELLSELRQLAPQVRFILMSGHAEEDVPGHGADVYLAKPFSRDQLVAAVCTATSLTPH